MTHSYNITGLKCDGCINAVKNGLAKIQDITATEVQLAAPQATITMDKEISVNELQAAIGPVYKISELVEQ